MKINNDEKQHSAETPKNSPRSQKGLWVFVGTIIVIVVAGIALLGGHKQSNIKDAKMASSSSMSMSSSDMSKMSDKTYKKVENQYANGINTAPVKYKNTKDMVPVLQKVFTIMYNYSTGPNSNTSRADKISPYTTNGALNVLIPADMRTEKAQATQSLKVTYKTTKKPDVTSDNNGKFEVLITYTVKAFDQTQKKQDSYTIQTDKNKIISVVMNGTISD